MNAPSPATRPFLKIKNLGEDEPGVLHIQLTASNGSFMGAIDAYCSVDSLKKFGEGLQSFPKDLKDSGSLIYGSEDPAARAYRFLSIRAAVIDSVGRCALKIRMNLNRKGPDEGEATFSIPAEPSDLNFLGTLLTELSTQSRSEFVWNPGWQSIASL